MSWIGASPRRWGLWLVARWPSANAIGLPYWCPADRRWATVIGVLNIAARITGFAGVAANGRWRFFAMLRSCRDGRTRREAWLLCERSSQPEAPS
jgi:hypothetical protein